MNHDRYEVSVLSFRIISVNGAGDGQSGSEMGVNSKILNGFDKVRSKAKEGIQPNYLPMRSFGRSDSSHHIGRGHK